MEDFDEYMYSTNPQVEQAENELDFLEEDTLEEEPKNNEDLELYQEVEKRLEIASYYRLLLNDTIFNDTSEAAQKVEEEIRNFIRTRLKVLVGVKIEKKEVTEKLPFDAGEVEILKSIINKIKKKPQLLQNAQKKGKNPPSLKKVTTKNSNKPSLKKNPTVSKEKVTKKASQKVSKKKEPELNDIIEMNGQKYRMMEVNGELTPVLLTKTPQQQGQQFNKSEYEALMMANATRDLQSGAAAQGPNQGLMQHLINHAIQNKK